MSLVERYEKRLREIRPHAAEQIGLGIVGFECMECLQHKAGDYFLVVGKKVKSRFFKSSRTVCMVCLFCHHSLTASYAAQEAPQGHRRCR